ncbi:MAG: MazG nucleotide pyrophosphohydrolase domain-containing protein [Solirubrobacteraceae bacterium]
MPQRILGAGLQVLQSAEDVHRYHDGHAVAPDHSQSLLALDELTHLLRCECPWDREQDERSIVPHTVEEAYELADAAHQGDDAKLLDELGDVLFQVMFLSLLLEERGAGDLGQVAEHCRQKLIRRHPHVFSDTQVADAGEVLRNWDAIKADEPGRERGVFGEVPENLPALLYARKLQRRAATAGLHPSARPSDGDRASAEAASGARAAADRPEEDRTRTASAGSGQAPDARGADRRSFEAIGERLFELVDEARLAHVDPELALRAAAQRFRESVGPQEIGPQELGPQGEQ